MKIRNRFKYLFHRNLLFIIENPDTVLELGLDYLSELPYYFERAWSNNQKLNWNKVFSFINLVVDKYWSKHTREWDSFIGYSAWLIKAATKDDSRALSGQELINAKDL